MMLVHQGRYANSDVYLEAGEIRKTFNNKHFFVKATLGRYYIFREFQIYKALGHVETGHCRRVDKYTLALRYIPGMTISECIFRNVTLPIETFVLLKQKIQELHDLKYVHLDIRNAKNIIIDPDYVPHIIDYQSSLHLSWFYPKFVRDALQSLDQSAVYKFQNKLCIEKPKQTETDFLNKVNKLRRLWVFKGYPLQHAIARLKKH